MSITMLNVSGLNAPVKEHHQHHQNDDVCFLQETHFKYMCVMYLSGLQSKES